MEHPKLKHNIYSFLIDITSYAVCHCIKSKAEIKAEGKSHSSHSKDTNLDSKCMILFGQIYHDKSLENLYWKKEQSFSAF